MQHHLEPRADLLYAIVSGPFDLAEGMEFLRQTFAASSAHALTKILIDMRAVEGELSLMDRYDLARYAAELQREPVRVAVLATEAQVWPDRFAENVANNRGLVVKVTTDEAEAFAWLNRESAVRAQA